MGASSVVVNGKTICVFPSFRHEKGCAAEGLVEATLNDDPDKTHIACAPQEVIDAGLATPVGEPSPGPVGGDCQSVPGCVTRKYLIAAGLGAGAGLLLGMLASKRTDVRLVLTGAGAAGGAIARAMMGLGKASTF
jgi:hypothetical protein